MGMAAAGEWLSRNTIARQTNHGGNAFIPGLKRLKFDLYMKRA